MEQTPFDPPDIEAIVFDVVGTLVDEDATWARIAEAIARDTGLAAPSKIHERWAELLEQRMAAVIAGAEPWQPHSELVSAAAEHAVSDLGGRLSSESAALVASADREYRAWPDVAPGTSALRGSRLLAGVSNADLDSLGRLANLNSISWDVALSTAAVRNFKPAPAAYEYALAALRLDPRRTLFVAAHPWDLRAAAQHGFRTAYVARPGALRPSEADRFDLEVDHLLALSNLLG